MKKWLAGLGILVIMSLGVFFGLVYFRFGLREYLWVRKEMVKVEGSAESGIIGGIYAGVRTKMPAGERPQIWFWWKGKLDVVTPSKKVYLYQDYTLCTPEKIKTEGQLPPESSLDIEAWASRVKPGDYIRIEFVKLGTNGEVGKMGKVMSQDWYPFKEGNIEKQCTR